MNSAVRILATVSNTEHCGLQGDVKNEGWASEAAELEQGTPADSHRDLIALHSKKLLAKRSHPHPMLDDNADDSNDSDDGSDDGSDSADDGGADDGGASDGGAPDAASDDNATAVGANASAVEEVKDDQEGYAHYKDACDTEKDPLDLTMNCWLRLFQRHSLPALRD